MAMTIKVLLAFTLVAVYSQEASAGCLPSLPCRCPCELGIEYPSYCGICVCPPACPICISACYYPPASAAACPRCAPASYCYGGTGKK
ncbi:hypothetical protein V5799_033703 [Amblyomma americanum]|uniref:Secreted protein n=1 Tax=Amblyomma americanum TaxID=6943 RepID=A0AAQ4DMJ8_AMBAM